MAVLITLVIILAGCSNSGSNDSGNKSSDSNKKIMTKKITNFGCSELR